ncbi:hypothetical protein [Alkaliflexus imshenetskii]|uniref:hypothetical protein n=1 Tax=Alkaliflexus imshenetskii TaxID=286730 RepID=UPI0004B5859E|nr:hypothetical protein [Alkaliflexus imshenetskii]
MIWKVLLLSLVLVALVAILMSVGILLKKNGKFPSGHIGGNKEMAKRGISCATSQDREARKKGRAM